MGEFPRPDKYVNRILRFAEEIPWMKSKKKKLSHFICISLSESDDCQLDCDKMCSMNIILS